MKQSVAISETIPGDLTDLRAFCAVVDLGSITAAAKTLHETKGSVSRRISRLERALGVALVRRSPRLVTVTEDGAAFRVRVGRALEMLDDATHELHANRGTPRGLLRITTPGDLGAMFAPVIARFCAKYPDIRVEAILTQASLDFEAHQLDIAIRAAGTLRDSSLVAHKMVELEMAFFASPAYLATRKAPRRVGDLADHRVVAMRIRPGEIALDTRSDAGVEERVVLKPAIVVNDNDFVRMDVLEGAGIGVLPVAFAERDVADERLVRVLEKHRIAQRGAIYLMHSSSPFMAPRVRVFRDFLMTEMKAQCATQLRRGR